LKQLDVKLHTAMWWACLSAPLISHRNQPSIVKLTQHKVGKVFSMQTKNHYNSSHCIHCPPPQRSPAAWFHYCRCAIV